MSDTLKIVAFVVLAWAFALAVLMCGCAPSVTTQGKQDDDGLCEYHKRHHGERRFEAEIIRYPNGMTDIILHDKGEE